MIQFFTSGFARITEMPFFSEGHSCPPPSRAIVSVTVQRLTAPTGVQVVRLSRHNRVVNLQDAFESAIRTFLQSLTRDCLQ